MTNASLLIGTFALLVLTVSAPTNARIAARVGGGTRATITEMHACMLLITRDDIGADEVAFGAGSIVSRNRVLTAAHVVRDANIVHVGYFAGAMQENRFRRADSSYSQPIQSFNVETFDNDVAVVQFATNVFPAANVIAIGTTTPAIEATAAIASFGFTVPNSLVPSQIPNISQQQISECGATVNNTPSHFCGTAQGTSVVCFGDNGAGLYTGEGEARRLVGVVSLIRPGCTEAGAVTGYASLSGDRVQAFLNSQGLAARA